GTHFQKAHLRPLSFLCILIHTHTLLLLSPLLPLTLIHSCRPNSVFPLSFSFLSLLCLCLVCRGISCVSPLCWKRPSVNSTAAMAPSTPSPSPRSRGGV